MVNKFIQNNKKIKFNWAKDKILICDRNWDATHNSYDILRNEYTRFGSSHPLWFGGFRFADIIRMPTNTDESLTAIVSIYISCPEKLIETIFHVIPAGDRSRESFDVKLKKPIIVMPGMTYDIFADFSHNINIEIDKVTAWKCIGHAGHINATLPNQNITIEFKRHPKSEYSIEFSIVSQLYFNVK